MHFWDGRSAQDREAIDQAPRGRRRDRAPAAQERGDQGRAGARRARAGQVAWLLDTVATVSGRRRADVQLGSRFGELGFDSLMYAELSSALENAGIALPDSVDVTTLGTVAELQELLARGPAAGGARARRQARAATTTPRSACPAPCRRAGKRGLAWAQRAFYQRVLATRVKGASHIPQHTSFIVAANHCSHLDMGAIKVALGDAGRDLTSLAAADYFFRNRYRRAYFKHFTNLVPMERSGSIRKSMDTAESVLRRGRSMVVFPEGTRSVTGEMADFLPSLGYLAMRAEVGVLPGARRRQLRGAAQGDGGAARARADGVVRSVPCARVAGGADRRPAAAGGVAAGGGVHPAGGREPARRRGDGARRRGGARRVGRQGARPDRGARARAAPPRAEVGAMSRQAQARPTTLVTGRHRVPRRAPGAHARAARTRGALRVLVHSAPPAWLTDARDVEIVSGSVTSPDDVARVVAGVDQIYHLAGMVSHSAADAHRMYAVHVDGTRLVCEAAARAGVSRIVMASTSGTVAVSRRADDVADEETPAPVDIIVALGLLREQALSGRDGAPRLRRQGGAGHREPEPAAGPGRRSPELDPPDRCSSWRARSR